MNWREVYAYGCLTFSGYYTLNDNITNVMKMDDLYKYYNLPTNNVDENGKKEIRNWTSNEENGLPVIFNYLKKIFGDHFSYYIDFNKMYLNFIYSSDVVVKSDEVEKKLPLSKVVDIEENQEKSKCIVDITEFRNIWDKRYIQSIIDKYPLANYDMKALIENIKDKNIVKQNNGNNEIVANVTIIKDDSSIDAIDEINDLIGLNQAKEELFHLIANSVVEKLRASNDIKTKTKLSKHMVFEGDPGTGKTTLAKLFAKAMFQNGIIKENKLVSVTRADLVVENVGQTSIKTQNVIDTAKGGVLFIDEAYDLYRPGNDNDSGMDAITVIMDALEEDRDKLIVIMAGYTAEMNKFIKEANPGLKSRIPNVIHFDSYNKDEMIQVLLGMFKKDDVAQPEDVEYMKVKVGNYILKNNPQGNARWVRNLYQNIFRVQATRLAENIKALDLKSLKTIINSDIDEALEMTESN